MAGTSNQSGSNKVCEGHHQQQQQQQQQTKNNNMRNPLKPGRTLFMSPVYVKRTSTQQQQQQQQHEQTICNNQQQQTICNSCNTMQCGQNTDHVKKCSVKVSPKLTNLQQIFKNTRSMHPNKESFTQTSKTILELARLDEANNMSPDSLSPPSFRPNKQRLLAKECKSLRAERETNEPFATNPSVMGNQRQRPNDCDTTKLRKQSPPRRWDAEKTRNNRKPEKCLIGEGQEICISSPKAKGHNERMASYLSDNQPTFLGDAEHLMNNKDKTEFTINTTPVIAMMEFQANPWGYAERHQPRITSYHSLFHVRNNEIVINDANISNDPHRFSTIKEEESMGSHCKCAGDVNVTNKQAITKILKEANSQGRFLRKGECFECPGHPIVVNIIDKNLLNNEEADILKDAPFVRNITPKSNRSPILRQRNRHHSLLASIPIKCQLMRNARNAQNSSCNFKSKSVVVQGRKTFLDDTNVPRNGVTKSCTCNNSTGSKKCENGSGVVGGCNHKVLHVYKMNGKDLAQVGNKGIGSCSAPLLEPQVSTCECALSSPRRTFMSPTLSSEQKSQKAAVESVKTLVDLKLNSFRGNNKEKSFINESQSPKNQQFQQNGRVPNGIVPRLVKSEDISKRDTYDCQASPNADEDGVKVSHHRYQRHSIEASTKFNHVTSTSTMGSTDSTENGLYVALMSIKSPDWNCALKGLADVVDMARSYNRESFLPFMTIVNQRLLELLKSPRSHVCRTSCQLAGHLFQIMRDTRRPEFDDIVNTLLFKTADSNKFIRHDANLALDAMVTYIPTFHAIRSVCAKGPTHRNALVRCAAVRLLICAVVIAGPTNIMQNVHHEHSRRRIINNLLYFLDDKNIDIRKYAERLYKILAKESTFDHYLKKYLDKSKIDALMRLLKFANKNPF